MKSTNFYSDVVGELPVATLTDNARTVLAKRYLKRDPETNEVCEEPEDMFWRVASTVAMAEKRYGKTEDEIHELALQFYNMMRTGKWLPNSPTLFNAGRRFGQLSACFVLPIKDELVGGDAAIYRTLEHMAAIHQSGGGTGFSFSKIRPQGDVVKSTSGVASGPVSFMRLYDASTDVVKQGGNRRGANMGILRVDHPDIEEFITCKADTSQVTNFNISVAVTDEFMEAVRNNEDYDLVSPKDGTIRGQKNARKIFNMIIEQAHATGEPGLFFIDKANAVNPVPHIGKYEATNPCGEQPLLSYDVCNLGSLNIGHEDFFHKGEPNWVEIERIQTLAIRFLDNVIDINQYPLPEIRDRSDAIRRIGAGVMGWADYLIRCGIAYDSQEALDEADKVSDLLHTIGHLASSKLAEERGAFPEWERSIWGPDATCARDENGNRIRRERKMRNCNVDTVAPTGTISIIAGCSGGIEPLYAAAFQRYQADELMHEAHPVYRDLLEELHPDMDIEGVLKDTINQGHIPEYVDDRISDVIRTSHDIRPEIHIRMQAAWQENIDSAISKTINFPNEATIDDVREGYLLAHELDCKGVTVYRDGSRPGQVLSTGKTGQEEETTKPEPRRKAQRPKKLSGDTLNIEAPLGTLYVTINDMDGDPFEVFVNLGKAGGAANADAEAIGRLISLGLRHGVPMREVYAQLRNISSEETLGFGPNKVRSTPDGIAILIGEYLGLDINDNDIAHPNGVDDKPVLRPCPECSLRMTFEEGCAKCYACGHSECS